jgi:hypothetical protein
MKKESRGERFFPQSPLLIKSPQLIKSPLRKKRPLFIKSPQLIKSLLLIASLSVSWQATAEQFDLSDTPLFTLAGVNPNIVLTMDDSGSMAWSFMPTSVGDHPSTKRAKSSTFNKIYYDPEILYDPR